MSLLRKLSLMFLILISLLIGGVILLLSTSSGINLILQTVTHFVPGLSIKNVDGSLRNLKLIDTHFAMDGVDVALGELSLAVGFSCIIDSKVCINSFSAKNVQVIINTALIPATPEDEQSEPLTDLTLPFPLLINNFNVENVDVKVDDITIQAKSLSTAAEWQGRTITLHPAILQSLTVSLPVTEEKEQNGTESGEKLPINQSLQAIFAPALLSSLPDVIIPIDVVVQQLNANDSKLTGAVNYEFKAIQLRGDLTDSVVRLEQLNIKVAEADAYLMGLIALKDQWSVKIIANGDIKIDPIKGEKFKLEFDGKVLGKLQLNANFSGPQRLNVQGNVDMTQDGLPIELKIISNRLKWPATGDAEYQIDNLDLALGGKVTDYLISMSASIHGKEIPPAKFFLNANGNADYIIIDQMLLNALKGSVRLDGAAEWSKAISFRTNLVMDGINTKELLPDWPALLNGNVVAKGSAHGGSWQFDVSHINVNGKIKAHELVVSGAARGNAAAQWRFDDFVVLVGPNKITANGDMTDKWMVDAKIDAPDLSGFIPDLSGTLQGDIQLRGSIHSPKILADINGSKLKFLDINIEKFALKGDVLSDKQIGGSVNVILDQLVMGETQFKHIALNLSGNEKQHKLELNADGKPVGGNIALNGQFDRNKERWQGALASAQFSTPLGLWNLQKAMSIEFDVKLHKAVIGTHCWLNQHAEICADKPINAGKSGNASLTLKRVYLEILKPFIAETDFKGTVSGKVSANWKDDGKMPQIMASLQSDNMAINAIVGDIILPVQFDIFTLNVQADNQSANAKWNIKIKDNGFFSGNVTVKDPLASRSLSGDIIIDALSLKTIQPMLLEGEKATGILTGKLGISGNLKRPLLNGKISLTHLVLDMGILPVTVNEGELNIDFYGTNSRLSGVIKTAKGQLELHGDADWRDIQDWRANISAKGDRIRISVPPLAEVDVSPDIVVSATPTHINLSGEVNIPWANIEIKELPESVVSVSKDEVLLNNNLQPIVKKESSMVINSSLKINIGRDVSVKAFGLKANLSGSLLVRQDKNVLGLHGQIDILRGSFKAYGQDLIIRKGLFIFAGPVDKPQLHVEAVRNPLSTENNVTAGLRVTGFADQPKLEVFSDPAMSQEEALSYLFRGQGLNSSSDDGDIMTSLLIGIGVAGTGKLVGQIGETFGVKNLTLDTQGVGDSSQVVVSGYVLPGLQVKYGIGVFDSLATFTLRYRLMPRLYLEAVSGLDQAIDLLYQFEF